MPVFTADPPSALADLPSHSPLTPTSVLSSITAFARFEFEFPNRGNNGTKVLMVEWEDDDVTHNIEGAWQVSWEGKLRTQYHAEDEGDNLRRLYFLLGPGQTIPPNIVLRYEPPPDSGATARKSQRLTIQPLPAIFPPELGEAARQMGKKGVLHTIWAKRRLQVLDREIEKEQEFNLEGIALEMAVAERDWIESNFGVPSSQHRPSIGSARSSSSTTMSVAVGSPKTPVGTSSRLNEKLKGLSIGTSDKALRGRPEGGSSSSSMFVKLIDGQAVNTPSNEFHPLSPEGQDMAVSYYGSFRKLSPLSTIQSVDQDMGRIEPRSGLDLQADLQVPNSARSLTRQQSTESGDELFAKAISPRTPAVGKSPFSFSKAEVLPYLPGSEQT